MVSLGVGQGRLVGCVWVGGIVVGFFLFFPFILRVGWGWRKPTNLVGSEGKIKSTLGDEVQRRCLEMH